MKLDTEFEPTADDFSLPDRLLDRVEKLWKGLTRVVVEKKDKKSWKKVNGFATSIGIQSQPDDQPEHVAAMIVAIAAFDVEDSGEEGVYRVRFIREINGKEDKRFFSFKRGFGDETGDVLDPGDADMATMIGTVLNAQNGFIAIQNAHVEAQNARILELSNASTKQIDQLLRTNEALVEKYHQGLAMQANALTLMLDVERNLEVDKQKAKNTERAFDMLKTILPTALKQFGSYMKTKAGMADTDEDEDEEEEGESKTEEAGGEANGEKGEDDGLTADQRKLQENLRKRPLTTFAHAFKDSISTDQWFDLAQVLSKKQIGALKQACYAENDEATAEGILAFRELLLKNAAKLAELGSVLSEKQMQMIMRLNEKAGEFDQKA